MLPLFAGNAKTIAFFWLRNHTFRITKWPIYSQLRKHASTALNGTKTNERTSCTRYAVNVDNRTTRWHINNRNWSWSPGKLTLLLWFMCIPRSISYTAINNLRYKRKKKHKTNAPNQYLFSPSQCLGSTVYPPQTPMALLKKILHWRTTLSLWSCVRWHGCRCGGVRTSWWTWLWWKWCVLPTVCLLTGHIASQL